MCIMSRQLTRETYNKKLVDLPTTHTVLNYLQHILY